MIRNYITNREMNGLPEMVGLNIAQAAAVAADEAVQAHMRSFGTDRQTAMQWIRTALELLSNQDEISRMVGSS
jgi:hypothetical protein